MTDDNASADDKPVAMKTCPYCAESIRAEATVCRYCSRGLTPETARTAGGKFLRFLGWSAVVLLGCVVVMVIWGSQLGRGSFNGSNQDAYNAAQIFGSGLTYVQIDPMIDDIAEKANVSHSDAEKLAINCMRAYAATGPLDPQRCVEFAVVARKLDYVNKLGN